MNKLFCCVMLYVVSFFCCAVEDGTYVIMPDEKQSSSPMTWEKINE